jgi:ketosteroid isomerase-like protein
VVHADTVRAIYQAFGRGDVNAILNYLADDIEWEYGPNSTDVPWLQPLRGRAQIPSFFESLRAIEFHRFEPTIFLENGYVVVALVDLEATVRATGRRIVEVDEVHIWHFDSDGKVIKFRHRIDTHQQWVAYGGR